MRRMIVETLERVILLQIGAAAATREKIQEIVDRLIERGRIECEEGRAVVKKVLDRVRERSVGARSLVDVSMHQGLRGAADVPTRDAYEDLLFCVEQLEHQVRRLLEARGPWHRVLRGRPRLPCPRWMSPRLWSAAWT